jgi:hypothetical protein
MRGFVVPRGLAVTVALFLFSVFGVTEAHAQAFTPVAPSDGRAFSWAEVEDDGVGFVVAGTPGEAAVWVEISRGAGFSRDADFVPLNEESPGVYTGTSRVLSNDETTDSGSYFWRARGITWTGPSRSFSIRSPDWQPPLRIAAPSRMHAGARSSIVLRYRAESAADRLHLIVASDCPESPGGGSADTLVAAAEPPAGGQMAVAFRPRAAGRVSLCAYVTAAGAVTWRATRTVDVVRAAVTRRQMLRWRLSPGGLGPIEIGMTVGEIERATGRRPVKSFGDYSACQIWMLPGAPGLSLMRSYGRLVRVEAFRRHWRTARGVRIGDSARKVFRRYGRVHVKPHPYTTGKYLIVGPPGRRMIFETNGARKVTSFRGGRGPYIGYIEGCV